MMRESRLIDPAESFWTYLSSALSGAEILRGNSLPSSSKTLNLERKVHFPLTACDLSHLPARLETVVRAGWAIVLARHTGSSEVVFSSSFRDDEPWSAPLRVVVPSDRPVSEWLIEFEGWLKKAEACGPVPPEVLANLREEGVIYSIPTFLIGMSHSKVFSRPDQSNGPLVVRVKLDTSQIEIDYDSAWFSDVEARALGEHLNVVLESMSAFPQSPIGKLPALTGKELRLLLDEWNDTATPFAENQRIHEFFEEQAARTPEAVAVVFCDKQWTYQQLDEQAEILARRLRSAGVGPGDYVAVCVERSLELLATLLAVFKAGAAYVPLDPSYPVERLGFMINDAKPALIAVSQQTTKLFATGGSRHFFVDRAGKETNPTEIADSPAQHSSSDTAYLLYTSGSTGKPKGVVITHRNVANFFTAMDAIIGPEPGVWLAVTSVNFDISVFELFWTLARGFRVILQEEAQWASQGGSKYSLPTQLRRHGVTHLQCTPSLASMLICDPESAAGLKKLRRFAVGGEPLPIDVAHRLAESIEGDLLNLYGPTETTVWSTAQRIGREDKQILIGRPVANTRLYVLDAERELVPIGSAGELYIGGEGLAREYLHRPDLTQDRFVTHTFFPGRTERLYRTGDLVRYQPDSRLEFLGRIDQQIKIRGVRIELGEIEVVLREHPDVHDAAVSVDEDAGKNKRLVAYIVPAGLQPPGVSQLQKWLGDKLPKNLVPSVVIFLPGLPKTPNGKLDRRALPKSDRHAFPLVENCANDLERQIAAIWSEALGVQSVGLDERFFDLGGHSLLMVRVHDQLREKAGRDVPLLEFFQFPTIRSLAKHLTLKSSAVARKTSSLNRGRIRQEYAARQNLRRRVPPAKKSS